MATRMTESHELAARCQRAGWKVTKPRSMSGAYKVYPPNGEMITIHLTYSDVRSIKNVLADLKAAGLEKDEQRMAEKEERDKAAKLEAERRAADAKALALASQGRLVRAAAGPYAGPEEVEIDWFLEPHPAPWMRWAIITPEIAAKILEANTDNRPKTQAIVDHYKKVILSGQWHLTHQGMAMDTRAILQDGQHRLYAVRDTGIPVPVAFFVGMPPENFKAIDEGLLRRAADLFGKDGEANTLVLQAAVNLVRAYVNPTTFRSAIREKTTNEVIYDLFHDDPDELRAAVMFGKRHFQAVRIAAGPLAAARYLIRKKNGPDNPYVEAFFTGLIAGCKPNRMLLEERDPRLSLRRYMALNKEKGTRMRGSDQFALTLLTWNYVIQDYRPRNLRWAIDMPIPQIRQITVNGDYASATPPLLLGEVEPIMEKMREEQGELVAA